MLKGSIATLIIGFSTSINVAYGTSITVSEGDCVSLYWSNWAVGVDSRLRIEAPRTKSISTMFSEQYNGVVLRTWMSRDDNFSHVANGAPRAEINFSPVAHLINGRNYQITWSTLIPKSYRIDMLQPEIISQIHQSSREIGSPPFSLMIFGENYQVDVRGGRGTPSRSYKFGNPGDDRGKIIHWILDYRPDHSGENAVVALYKNDVNVVNSVGAPNAYESEQNGYFKIGVYKWWWITRGSEVTTREIYFGDVKIEECNL